MSYFQNADCQDTEVLMHVDSFLFSDDYIDEMVDAGKFSRNYCISCGSRDIKPLSNEFNLFKLIMLIQYLT